MSEQKNDNTNLRSVEDYMKALRITNQITEKAIKAAIKELNLFDGCHVLDVPCGVGNHAIWMMEENETINVVAMDYSEEHLAYAKKNAIERKLPPSLRFEQGDINNLHFENDCFDFIWCCDGLWPGPLEIGCLAEEPYAILADMVRVTKNGGTINIVFWTGQKLLPGYPLLEAALNDTKSANMPLSHHANPELHVMCTPTWLQKAGLKNITVKNFITNLQGPFDEEQKEGVLGFMNMFWGNSKHEVTPQIWDQYQTLTNLQSDDYILRQDHYAGFIVYTVFSGEVNK